MVFSIKLHIGRKQFEWSSTMAHHLRDLNGRLESATTMARNNSRELMTTVNELRKLKEELGVGGNNTDGSELPLTDDTL